MKYLMVALKYLPYILAGVKAVEESMAGAPGRSKKAVVMGAISAASAVGEQVPEDHVKVISALIDSTVTQLNAAGVFKTTGTGHGMPGMPAGFPVTPKPVEPGK